MEYGILHRASHVPSTFGLLFFLFCLLRRCLVVLQFFFLDRSVYCRSTVSPWNAEIEEKKRSCDFHPAGRLMRNCRTPNPNLQSSIIKLFHGGMETLKPRPHTANPIKPEAFPPYFSPVKNEPPGGTFSFALVRVAPVGLSDAIIFRPKNSCPENKDCFLRRRTGKQQIFLSRSSTGPSGDLNPTPFSFTRGHLATPQISPDNKFPL